MHFTPIERLAAALLYEGYALYPYRPSAVKNRPSAVPPLPRVVQPLVTTWAAPVGFLIRYQAAKMARAHFSMRIIRLCLPLLKPGLPHRGGVHRGGVEGGGRQGLEQHIRVGCTDVARAPTRYSTLVDEIKPEVDMRRKAGQPGTVP